MIENVEDNFLEDDDVEITSSEIQYKIEREDFIVDKGQEQIRIDKYIQSKLSQITRNKIQTAIEEERILVNDQPTKANYKIRPLDKITVISITDASIPTEIIPEEIPLNIVYEDDQVIVINKPANMVVHPGNGNYSGTLLNAIAFHLQKTNPELKDVPPRIGLVHRIDKDTTGLILIAKTDDALTFLQKQFFEHTVHRRYIALVWGDFENETGTIEGNIIRNEKDRRKMCISDDPTKGKHAITHYKLLENFLYVSLLEYRLETGRTHQIRVHSKSIGHPLFNDSTYGGNKIVKGTIFGKYKQFVENSFEILPRQALHAKELGFIHPTTKEYMQFDSEIPEDMAQVIERWRNYVKNKNENVNVI